MSIHDIKATLKKSANPSQFEDFITLAESLDPTIKKVTAPPRPVEKTAKVRPSNFPPDIPLKEITFINWSLAIEVPHVLKAIARTPEDVATLANWAKDNKYKIRASGHSHNWSPMVIANDANTAQVLLVDVSQLNGLIRFDRQNLTATFGIGTTVEQATELLQNLDNKGASQAPGYSWQNFTAPGALSLGGVLAIGAHGTGLPFDNQSQPLNGTMSNLVVSFKAVVTDADGPHPDEYVIKEFQRSDTDAAAFLVHLGRAFLTEVTMKVIPNYYLEVANHYPQADDLFQPPGNSLSDDAIASLLDKYGRVEVIWFPFTGEPWVKTWQRLPALTQQPVSGPYNYPWANDISLETNAKIKESLFTLPSLTPLFGKSQLGLSQLFAPATLVLQGTSRDLLLYVQDTTLRVTAIGYAVQLRREQVQEAAHLFYTKYQKLLEKYRDDKSFFYPFGKYPVNGPVELRWTTMDVASELGIAGSQPPALSVCHSVRPNDPSLDTVFWIDALTIPGTEFSNDFFVELEKWLTAQWGTAVSNVMRPEWSKGWAYTQDHGAWTNQEILTSAIPAHYNQPAGQQPFTWAKETLAKYDAHHIYTNHLLDVLL